MAEEGSGNTILANIKNTMSDWHIVEKILNELLEGYRFEVLLSIVEGWSDLSPDEQARMSNLNKFLCGLHACTFLLLFFCSGMKPILRLHSAAAHPGPSERKEAGIPDCWP